MGERFTEALSPRASADDGSSSAAIRSQDQPAIPIRVIGRGAIEFGFMEILTFESGDRDYFNGLKTIGPKRFVERPN